MKTIKFIGYLFYRYYSKGPRANIPYFSTMWSMTFLGFIHLMQILILLNKFDLIPINSSDDKAKRYFIMCLIMLPIYFVMTLLFKKSDVEPLKEKYDYNWDKVFKGNVCLVIYIIFSFTLIIALALWKKH
jgi:hypothetical protein